MLPMIVLKSSTEVRDLKNYEFVLQELINILQDRLRLSVESEDCQRKKLGEVFHKQNMIDALYFLLEFSIAFKIDLSYELIENYLGWNLEELAYYIDSKSKD